METKLGYLESGMVQEQVRKEFINEKKELNLLRGVQKNLHNCHFRRMIRNETILQHQLIKMQF